VGLVSAKSGDEMLSPEDVAREFGPEVADAMRASPLYLPFYKSWTRWQVERLVEWMEHDAERRLGDEFEEDPMLAHVRSLQIAQEIGLWPDMKKVWPVPRVR
jgi:hypothetical protein